MATTPKTPTPAPAQLLQVISKRDGFRRAGRAWSGTTTVPLADLSQAQLAALQAEPMLVTLLLDAPAA